ncbi:heat-inducible transcription repressor HrcA [bacterium]|nr:heat-inducible transcription repressor HrcA [bacterium]
MAFEQLTERERQVFLSIVQTFIESAEPVGSRYLSKYTDLNLSPATIRNVMMDLEDKGYLAQPHTSAGRVPTDSGYRLYVDGMMEGAHLTNAEKKQVYEQLALFTRDLDAIVEHASLVLSDISQQLGVVLAPRFQKGKIEKIELVPLADDKVLFVLSITAGLVKTVIVEINPDIPASVIGAVSQLLNERLYGLSVGEQFADFDERFRDLDEKIKSVLQTLKGKTEKLVTCEPSADIYMAGTRTMLKHPEYASREKVGAILNLIDRRDILMRVLSEHAQEGVSIVIGEENKEELMKHCSVITTTYHVQDTVGTIGIIGPTRMPYEKIIGLVKFMSETLGYLIGR